MPVLDATDSEERCGRYALLILLVLTKRTRRAVFETLRRMGEL